MVAFDFPNSPTNGQIFAPPGGPRYQWNSPVWDVVGDIVAPDEAPSDGTIYGRKDAHWTPIDAPAYSRRRYIDIGDYAPSDDSQDAHLAIQTAFNDGYGREIVFTSPQGGTRAYRSLSRSSATLVMPLKARIIAEPGTTLDFSAWGRSGTVKHYMSASAPYGSVALTGAAAAGVLSLTVSAGAGGNFRGGNYYYLSSADLFTTEDATLGTKGEWVFVTAVAGDVLTLAAQTRDTYTTSPVVNYPNGGWCNLSIEGLNLIGSGRFTTGVGDRGIKIENGVVCHFRDCTVWNSDQMGIFAQNLLNSSVSDSFVGFENSAENSQNSYGIVLVNGCENFTVSGCEVNGGKEQFVLTVSGGMQGPTRDVLMTGNRARGARRTGFASHDNHVNWRVVNNVIEHCEQGVDCRIVDATITGNWFKHLGSFSGALDCAMQLGSGAGKVLFSGNTVDDAYRGVWMDKDIVHEVPPGDIDIIDNDFRNMRGIVVEIHNTIGSTAACGSVTVQGNRLETVASRGVDIEGKWKPVVTDNTLRGGAGGRSIYLHATANGAATEGPVDPVVSGNVIDATFTAPQVQHASGVTKTRGNRGIGQWLSGETLRGSIITQDWPSIGGGSFASVHVTVIGAVVGDKAEAWMDIAGPNGVWFKALVVGPDDVQVHCINFTGAPLDPGTGTLFVEVVKT